MQLVVATDPSVFLNILSLVLVSAAIPFALTLRCTSRCLSVQRWVPVILGIAILNYATALVDVSLEGIDLHPPLGLAMVAVVVLFCVSFIAEMRRRRA